MYPQSPAILTSVHRTVDADLEQPPQRVHAVLRDLASYPAWMPLVHRVAEVPGDQAVWDVTLRARVGPLARSKRLRMVRTVDESPLLVRFERRETDGRDHSLWTMEASVAPSVHHPGGSVVHIELRYEGGLWSGALDALLGTSVDDAVEGLRRQVADA